MNAEILAVLQLVVLHTVDGRVVHINPAQVITVAEAREEHDPAKGFTDKVHCIVSLSDGKFVTVIEECPEVRRLLTESKQ